MAALGTISHVKPSDGSQPRPVLQITDYNIERGRPLGAVLVKGPDHEPTMISPLLGYVIRQIRVVYRQLWPSHGQRFPQ